MNYRHYQRINRAGDICLALAGCAVVCIPCLLVAAIIVLDSPGPPLFSQIRIGKNGKPFKMYKFRSMYRDAEERRQILENRNEISDGPAFKMKNDPRITRVGRILRRTSIDELPQLINVLQGEMSLVGPRPPLPCEAEQYTEYERKRLSVKPGITCYWQCSGRSEIGFREWMRLDLKYIEEQGVWTDMKIMIKTAAAVITMRGAQ